MFDMTYSDESQTLGSTGLTLRQLMSYIYGAPILDVSRSHNDAPQSVGLLLTSDQPDAETFT